MARKKIEQVQVIPKVFTLQEIEPGINKLKKRIEEVNKLKADNVRYNDERVTTTEFNIHESIREIFGSNSPEFAKYRYHHIGDGPINMYTSEHNYQQYLVEGIPQTVILLQGLIKRLEEKSEELSISVTEHPVGNGIKKEETSNKVFIIHGHNEGLKETVARLISKLGLEPVILHEQANMGRTIIEKLSDYSDVGFAVALLTADDLGTNVNHREELKPRARQNVILELGLFIGILGRDKVCALYEEGVEIPSDYDGVLYTPIDPKKSWVFSLVKELKAAGFEIDSNKVL